MRRILFVDDESNVLAGLRRMLRGQRKEWDVRFAESGTEALEFLTSDAFDVVVSDMKMPQMNGAELLEQVKERFPQTVRVILSGHSEKDAVLRSTRCTHQYLSKPCDADMLRATLERSFVLSDRLFGEGLRELIVGLDSVPTLPNVYADVRRELEKPDSSLQRVGEIVEQDGGMSAGLLKLVNSAYFGLSTPVSNVSNAISLLGLETLASLILGIGVFEECQPPVASGYGVETEWARSLSVALLAREIGRLENVPRAHIEGAFLGGILHQLGQLVLAANLPATYAKLLATASNHDELIAAERKELGVSHGEVAGYLLGLWGLPSPVVQAITLHDDPLDEADVDWTPRMLLRIAVALRSEDASRLEEEAAACGRADRLEQWFGVAQVERT